MMPVALQYDKDPETLAQEKKANKYNLKSLKYKLPAVGLLTRWMFVEDDSDDALVIVGS